MATLYNFVDFFSGIGGFSLAAKWAGIEVANQCYSDIDPYANSVYSKNYPLAIPLGSIEDIDPAKLKASYPGEWIVTGGFPCQDISTAGRKQGISGSRSNLWFEMHRVISGLRPRYVVAENVSALTHSGLERVLFSLADIGYDAEWRTISAAQVGAPHVRKRIWIVAYPDSLSSYGDSHQGDTIYGDVGDCYEPQSSNDPSHAWANWQSLVASGRFRNQPLVYGVDDGLSRRVDKLRVKACGNSIVPQVAERIFRRIKQLDGNRINNSNGA